MKKIAILQSNYIPWKGYFDLIASVDEFVIYDDVQYTKNDWRNRNIIKTPSGEQWLTIPASRGNHQTVREVRVTNPTWAERHWKTLQANYAKASYFDETQKWLQPLYDEMESDHLSQINKAFIREICAVLGIDTKIREISEFAAAGGQTERLVNVCKETNAVCYVSGPAAKGYLDVDLFHAAEMEVEWFNYSGYRPYKQLWGGFVHTVSIIDLLFNCGPTARQFMRY